MKYIVAFVILLLAPSIAISGGMQPKRGEAWYQVASCNHLNGMVEVTLSDRTRVDCLTEQYAIEVDWDSKWAESIGQALHYARMTGKEGGIILINKKGKDIYAQRIAGIIAEYDLPIKLWVMSIDGVLSDYQE